MHTPDKPLTQIEKIIVHMFNHPEKHHWVAQDFMPPALEREHPLHVGYEATARLSDLVSKYNPEEEGAVKAFVVGRQGRFRSVGPDYRQFGTVLRAHPDLIPLARRTKVLDRFYGLENQLDSMIVIATPPKTVRPKFKSYVD